MTWLLRLYPREWRRRYGAEIEEVVTSHPKSLQLFIDLLGGAVDAHLKPQAFARRLEGQTVDRQGGSDMVNRLKCADRVENMTLRESFVSAGMAILTGLALAAILMVNESEFVETIALVMFPAFLAAPMNWMYLRGHSKLAKALLFVGPFVVCLLIGLLAWLVVSD